MSIDTSKLKRHDTERIAEMCNRLVLTIAWWQLDNLITAGVALVPHPSGVWRTSSIPTERGKPMQLGHVADSALRVTREKRSAIHDGTFRTEDVKGAKRAVRNVLVGWSVERSA